MEIEALPIKTCKWWLPLEGAHELIKQLKAEHEANGESEAFDKILKELYLKPYVELEPLNLGELNSLRNSNDLFQNNASLEIDGDSKTIQFKRSPVALELEFSRVLLKKRVKKVFNITGVKVDAKGKRKKTKINTISQLLDLVDSCQDERLLTALAEMSGALRNISMLGNGLGERSAWLRLG